jgi:phosphomannomutase
VSSNSLPNIFLAYDIRGKVGSELSVELVENVGKALADWLPSEGPVAVGHDMRPDSAELAAALVVGLTTQGRDVWDIGQVTSDMIYFTVGKHNLAGGAMITASHNPGDYNGIKLCREQARPIGIESGLADIRDNIAAQKYKASDHQGHLTEHDVTEGWIEHALSFIDVNELKPFKIVVDAGNGMAGKIFPELEPYVPWQVDEMYFELDGTFPNHIANPLEPKNLVDVIARVREIKADVGIAFDGDGDRAVLIDEGGNALSGTVMTAILSRYFLEKHPGSTILYNAICGKAVPDTIAKYGGKGIRTKVGHSFIKAEMSNHGAVFAGEHSGHYYFKDNYKADSGLIAAIVALAVLSESGKKLSDLAAEYRTYIGLTETNFEVNDKETVMQKIAAAFPGAKADWLDGLTLAFDTGWVNIRPSNTEPLLRLNAEAASKEELDQLIAKIQPYII